MGSSTSVLAGGCPEVDCRIVSNRSLCLGSESGRKRGSFFLSSSLAGDTGPYSAFKPFSATGGERCEKFDVKEGSLCLWIPFLSRSGNAEHPKFFSARMTFREEIGLIWKQNITF